MTTRNKSLKLLLIIVTLAADGLLWWTGHTLLAQADDLPPPLPAECGGSTGPGGTCCIYGYVYYDDAPVAGVSVHIESPHGALDPITKIGEASSEPYYAADLSSAPLSVSPGDVITITASYSDMASARTWTVHSYGQHVDLGLIAGYQAPGPISALTADALDSAALQASDRRATVQENIRREEYHAYLPDRSAGGFVAAPGEWRADQSASYPKRDIASALLTDPLPPAMSRAGALSAISDGPIFTDTHVITVSPHVSPTFDLDFGDANGDGYPDLAVGNHAPNQLCWNNGDYTFDCKDAFAGGPTFDVDWGYVDNDDDLDIVVSDHGGGQLNWVCLNNGNRTFTCTSFSTCTGGVYSPCCTALGDVDKDGDLDIALGIRWDQNLIYYNDGTGTFPITATVCSDYDYLTWTLDMEFGDVDNDDDLDLVVVGNGPGYVCINNGGAFTETRQFPYRPATPSVALTDADGDGDLDIAMGNGADYPIEIYLNDGHGFFVGALLVGPASDETGDLAWGDVDQDGDLDLAVSNWAQPNVVYFNDPATATNSITFTRKISFGLVLTSTYSVAFGDVDGDGDLDLAVGNNGQQNVVYINTLVVAPADVDITGPTAGTVDTAYTFTTTVRPITVTLPITHVWQATGQSPVTNTGGLSDTITFTWGTTGTETITVVATNAGGTVTDTHSLSLTGYVAPDAAFTASSLSGTAPLYVQFTDVSTGTITTWDWTFGDGGISGARHPSHTYEDEGVYTVSLTVSGPGGSDTEAKTDYITIEGSPPVAFIGWMWHEFSPDPAPQCPDIMIHFNGAAWDTDEDGAYIVAYNWRSDLDGWLSDHADFTIPASALSVGTHTIYFKAQDDEGEWSPEVTRTLTITPCLSQDVKTLILVNRQKLEALYSASEAISVTDKLDALEAHDSVQGLVVDLGNEITFPQVAAAYAAWDADPTSTVKANAVTAAIKDVVDVKWAAHPDLEYLVIVGDDRAIPFRRVPNQAYYWWFGWRGREQDYAYVSGDSTAGSALKAEMTLTDDYYADAVPTVPDSSGWDGHALYIPDLGTGRLIETPTEITAQIDAFLADDGVAASDAIVTGYDFVTDGAQAMCNALGDDGLTADCTLIGEGWGRDDFIAKVLNTRHDVVSINGHANHYVIGTPSGYVYSNDVAGATADHGRAVFYTVGCHSGLNVPPANPYQSLDIAQALVQCQANYVANTGYGWGNRYYIGLSEQLILDFTERLVYGQSATLGQALAAAKQEYYLNEGRFDYYDEKIMIESTLYGLPMYRYTTPTATAMQLQGQEATAIKEEQMTVLGNGLTVNSLSYQFPALTAESTDDGLYYTFGGLVQAGHGEPIQPKYTADLSFPQTKAHGVVFKGGAYTDVVSFDPVVDRAITTTETTTPPEPTFDAPGWYPPLLGHLNRLERGDRLVVLLGQFNPQSQTERLYNRLSFDVYYHTTSSDWTAPSITSVNSGLVGSTATITVNVSDVSGIEAVVAAYTDGYGTWASTSLTGNGETTWSGSFPASADTEFFVQAVDKAGNVAVDDNDGKYFKIYTIYLPLVLRNP